MAEYEFTIYEKAEHWRFYVTIKAESQESAYAQIKADYPSREYRIVECR